MISEDHVSQAEHNFDVQINGEYKICLDNSFSSDEKVVTIAVEHDLPDEMTVLLEKIHAKKQILKLPPGISVSRPFIDFEEGLYVEAKFQLLIYLFFYLVAVRFSVAFPFCFPLSPYYLSLLVSTSMQAFLQWIWEPACYSALSCFIY